MTDTTGPMKALICPEPGRLELIDRPRPPPPGPGEVRLAIARVGICGTDYHIHAGRQPFLSYPRIMGHEISAIVAEAGAGTTIPVGTLVVVNPYLGCGRCHACLKDRPNCCMAITVLGVHGDGAMCEEIVLPEANVYPATGLDPDAAACVEFLAIGAHAVRRSAAAPASRALVIGAGPIGLGTALFAGLAGLEVTISDASPARLDQARAIVGSAAFVLADGAEAEAFADLTGGNGFDVVFDATGNRASMEAALAHVAHCGALVYVGLVKDDIRFFDPDFHKREMTIIASRNALKADFDHVMEAIRGGHIPISRLVTHRTDLSGALTLLPAQVSDKTGLIKTLISVSDATP